jgi:hypothetical protein
LDGLHRFPPIDVCLIEIDGCLLLLRIIAVGEIPVVSTLKVVPVRVPITHTLEMTFKEAELVERSA